MGPMARVSSSARMLVLVTPAFALMIVLGVCCARWSHHPGSPAARTAAPHEARKPVVSPGEHSKKAAAAATVTRHAPLSGRSRATMGRW
jgi:hypothetical protein